MCTLTAAFPRPPTKSNNQATNKIGLKIEAPEIRLLSGYVTAANFLQLEKVKTEGGALEVHTALTSGTCCTNKKWLLCQFSLKRCLTSWLCEFECSFQAGSGRVLGNPNRQPRDAGLRMRARCRRGWEGSQERCWCRETRRGRGRRRAPLLRVLDLKASQASVAVRGETTKKPSSSRLLQKPMFLLGRWQGEAGVSPFSPRLFSGFLKRTPAHSREILAPDGMGGGLHSSSRRDADILIKLCFTQEASDCGGRIPCSSARSRSGARPGSSASVAHGSVECAWRG